jgi:hypothetical protein
MTAFKKYNYGLLIIILSWVFNLAETAYFGWNERALSPAEHICDFISLCIFIYGVHIYLKYRTIFIIESTIELVFEALDKEEGND